MWRSPRRSTGSLPGITTSARRCSIPASEAVENAVKIARSHTGRQAVVVFDHAYHGRTNLTMAMTAKNKPYKSGFGPFAPEVYRAPLSYPFRDGDVDGPAAAARAISIIEKQVGAENLAAVVIEPIQGEGGFIVPAPGFLSALAAWCRAQGVVFVADEVQTGFARTGAMFACDHEAVVPDLIVTAKGIAGGLPLSAVTGRAEIMDSPHVGGLGGTYGGNPLACAAALAVIDTIERDGLCARAREIGAIMVDRLHRDADKRRANRRRARPRRDDRRRTGPPGNRRTRRGADRTDRRVRPCPRADRADLRNPRQRTAIPSATGHARPPTDRGPQHPRRRIPGDLMTLTDIALGTDLVSEANPFDDARSQLREAATILGYDDGVYNMLATPRREVTVGIPLRRDNGEIEMLIGHRVQHNISRGPAKGGLRYSPDVDPRRGPRPRDVDDLEMRAARRSLRRRQGWRADRSPPVQRHRTGTRHPALHQ